MCLNYTPVVKPGDRVQAGAPILDVHYREAARLATALPLLSRAIGVSDEPPSLRPLIVGEVR